MENKICKKCGGKGEYSEQLIPAAGGSMGFGLPFGIGFALAKKFKKPARNAPAITSKMLAGVGGQKGKIFVLMSDGEMDCGTTWESALIAAHHKLNNLVVIIDYNGLQAMGRVKKILNIEPLKEKWRAFNWDVVEIDGHNFKQIEKAISIKSKKPLAIIAKTIKGYPISFMRGKNIYHYKQLSKKEYLNALKELNGKNC